MLTSQKRRKEARLSHHCLYASLLSSIVYNRGLLFSLLTLCYITVHFQLPRHITGIRIASSCAGVSGWMLMRASEMADCSGGDRLQQNLPHCFWFWLHFRFVSKMFSQNWCQFGNRAWCVPCFSTRVCPVYMLIQARVLWLFMHACVWVPW